ncbi:MAG: hypothetical protein E6J45_08695 [Chloroflexi bacterium]|nr:MAG: hypothetical protein E6J45_08695 [Chloroflexota bacterium]
MLCDELPLDVLAFLAERAAGGHGVEPGMVGVERNCVEALVEGSPDALRGVLVDAAARHRRGARGQRDARDDGGRQRASEHEDASHAHIVAAMIRVMAVLWRPRSAMQALAEHPSLGAGLVSVLATGVLALGLQVAAAALSGNAGDGLAISLALPLLFVAYWAIATSLIDAGARILGRAGRRRAFLAVSGAAFPALLAYALLSLAEGASRHWTHSETVASGLAWLTLPVLAWFLALTALAVRAVYDVPPLNAFAMAMLPGAALTGALIVLLLALAVLRAAGLI